MKPKAMLVPFGYPDYPQELLFRFLEHSKEVILANGLQLLSTPPVVVEGDVAHTRRLLQETDYDFLVVLLLSWVEAPLLVATLEDRLTNTPIVLWSHTTFEENGERLTLGALPAAGVVRQTLEEMGAHFKFIYGQPDNAEVFKPARAFALAAHARQALRGARIGLFGYVSMGMYTGTFDHTKLRREIGPEIVQLDQYTIVKKDEEISDQVVSDLVSGYKEKWLLAEGVTDEALAATMRQYAAIQALSQEHGFQALTVKCQYELSRLFGLAPCVALSLLGDELPVSCEGDVPLIVTQLMLHYLTGGGVTSYGDLHDIYPDDEVLFGACGFAPMSHAAGQPQIGKHTALYEGLLNTSAYKEGVVTLARVANDGDGYRMHIAAGPAHPPPPVREVECPPYPFIRIALDGKVDSLMQNLMSQHYAIVYGDIRQPLLELCGMLGIRPVLLEPKA
ncbi:MAG: L-fucose/L-arabinose isomerase family protein [Anaerolineae bacterium]